MNFLFVDSFISGNSLAHALIAQGHRCYHVFSSEEVLRDRIGQNVPSAYEKTFLHSSDIDLKWRCLRGIQIDGVIPGSDSGVEIADRLARVFDCPTQNFPNFCRLDRFHMQASLGEDCTDSNFAGFLAAHKHCVIKPRVSNGGHDRVRIVHEGDPVDDEDGMFISKFHSGTEYSVDMVSANGVHNLCAVWRYVRDETSEYWRNRIELVRQEEEPELVASIYSYMCYALSMADYKWGASHSEVMVSAEGKVNLIEVNWRVHGHLDYHSTRATFGRSQLDSTADAYSRQVCLRLDPAKYETSAYVFKTYLQNKRARMWSEIDWKALASIPSVAFIFHHFRYFDTVPVSEKSEAGVAAHVILRNPDRALLLEHEAQLLRTFE